MNKISILIGVFIALFSISSGYYPDHYEKSFTNKTNNPMMNYYPYNGSETLLGRRGVSRSSGRVKCYICESCNPWHNTHKKWCPGNNVCGLEHTNVKSHWHRST